MANNELKIFGAFRTGTNLVRSLLELNFDVEVHQNNMGYKHLPVPANFKNNKYIPFPIGIVSTVKEPFAFLDSVYRYCQKSNYLNIRAGRTFDEFCYQKFIVFDGGFKEFPRYQFANPIQYWNSMYRNLLSLPEEGSCIVVYEKMLTDLQGNILEIGTKFKLKRTSEKFIHPTGVTMNLADQARSETNDYFDDSPFERHDYYLERQYLDNFTDAQKDFIASELDHEVMRELGYSLEDLGWDAPEDESAPGTVAGIGKDRSAEAAPDVSRMPKVFKFNAFRIAELENRLTEQRHSAREQKEKLEGALIVANHQTAELDKILAEKSEQERARQIQHQRQIARLDTELKALEEELNKARIEYRNIRDSFSYKMGRDMVNALIKPGKNTLLLPARVFANWKSSRSTKKAS